MRRLSLMVTGILLSVLLIVPAYAGQADVPAEKPNKTNKNKAIIPAQVEQVKPGGQLNERGKRRELRDKAGVKKRQLINAGSGQQGQ